MVQTERSAAPEGGVAGPMGAEECSEHGGEHAAEEVEAEGAPLLAKAPLETEAGEAGGPEAEPAAGQGSQPLWRRFRCGRPLAAPCVGSARERARGGEAGSAYGSPP